VGGEGVGEGGSVGGRKWYSISAYVQFWAKFWVGILVDTLFT